MNARSTLGQTAPLIIELWYEEMPDLGEPLLLEALRSPWPATESQLESIVVPQGEPPSPQLTIPSSLPPQPPCATLLISRPEYPTIPVAIERAREAVGIDGQGENSSEFGRKRRGIDAGINHW